MDTTILAIDLGKFNSVLCWYDTRNTAFRSIRTGHAELLEELTRQPVRLVVFEARMIRGATRATAACVERSDNGVSLMLS